MKGNCVCVTAAALGLTSGLQDAVSRASGAFAYLTSIQYRLYPVLEHSWPWSCTWISTGQIMLRTHVQNLQYNPNIDKQIIHNLVRLLYSNRNRSCFRHPLCDLSQDRQLSGLHSLSWSILASDPTWDVQPKIYSLIQCGLTRRVYVPATIPQMSRWISNFPDFFLIRALSESLNFIGQFCWLTLLDPSGWVVIGLGPSAGIDSL